MSSIRSFFCAILLATAAGCGGSTNAETVSATGIEASEDASPEHSVASDATQTAGPAAEAIPEVDAAASERRLARASEAGSQPDAPQTATRSAGGDEPAGSGTSAAENAGLSTEQTAASTPLKSSDPTSQPGSDATKPSVRLQSRTVLDGSVMIEVPDEFHAMSQAMREQRYSAGQRPSFVLTNSAGNVNIAFNLTPNEMTLDQLPDFQRQMAALFRGQVESNDWIGSTTTQINGLDWFTIEMRTEAFGTKVWNLIAGTSLNGRLLLVSFNATTELESEWSPICNQMLQSVKLAADPIQQPELSATQ